MGLASSEPTTARRDRRRPVVGPFALLAAVLGSFALKATAAEPAVSPEAADFFEKEVRPLLAERCQGCHGPQKQWAELRLDSRAAALKGGESGPAVVPGDPAASELLRRVTDPDEEVRMPPAEKGERLTSRQIDALTEWVRRGAPWPEAHGDTGSDSQSAKEHWAFQPVRRPPLPEVSHPEWCQTPIDRFVLARLEADGLEPSPAATRRELIRRATYDLLGLPPTPAEVEAFVRDEAPDAYERLIDRLLASPHYGEQWGRHWLDVARYSDTKGYVYAREERYFVHASHYRDWVVRALNDDIPYDRFLLLQLAADQVAPDEAAAMGFLTLGRRFLGVTHDIIDDRIDVVTRGLMGLTVGCARCHDHKYDPIPQADYYSLYGVFQNCAERLMPLPHAATDSPEAAEFLKGLKEREQKLAEATAAKRAETSERIRARIADYLLAQRELGKYPEMGFDQVLSKEDLIPTIVRRWQTFLTASADDPVFVPWTEFARLKDDEFATQAVEVTRRMGDREMNPRIAAVFAEPPASAREVAERYGRVFAGIDASWREVCGAAERHGMAPPAGLPDPADEALRQVLYGPASPCVIPDEPIVNNEMLYDTATVNELWKLQVDVDQWLLKAPELAPHAVILTDRAYTANPRIFRRGNPTDRGDEVPRQFPEVVAGADRTPFTHGSGRLELAQAIVDPANPLTARVWANRVWMHHFGAGLVRTPSDFGRRSDPPSHPELLDWLANELTTGGWSTKRLHRAILLSATYRQSSRIADFGLPIADLGQSDPQALDPENRLLWRMNARRLSYEELRDTLVAASGRLDPAMGGKAVEQFSAEGAACRRTVYGLVDRQFVPGVMRVFDFANPDLHSPQRSETTVPQQALFTWNSPFFAGQAKTLAAGVNTRPSDAFQGVRDLYQAVFQREPTAPEFSAAEEFIAAARLEESEEGRPPAAAAWSYGCGEFDEAAGKLKDFHPLPYFDGVGWQGGPQWPDATLGWVRLTAEGGHPGNDLSHAAVRRWTAPRDGTVAVTSILTHEVAAGDGIRCRIVSDRQGVLASTTIHNAGRSLDVRPLDVRTGETIDFVTDRYENLNSDQFLWSAEVRMIDASADASAVSAWNSSADFAGPRPSYLGPWEQLAQVLLMSNELMFVD